MNMLRKTLVACCVVLCLGFLAPNMAVAAGTSLQQAQPIGPGFSVRTHKPQGMSHYYQIRLRRGQTLVVRLRQEGRLVAQLRYKGSICGTPFRPGYLVLTTDPCERYDKVKEFRFIAWWDATYIIVIGAHHNRGGKYQLSVAVR